MRGNSFALGQAPGSPARCGRSRAHPRIVRNTDDVGFASSIQRTGLEQPTSQ